VSTKIETVTNAKILSFLMFANLLLFGFFCFSNVESPITTITPSVMEFFSVNVFRFGPEPIDRESFRFNFSNFLVHLFVFYVLQALLINLHCRTSIGKSRDKL